MQRYKLGRKYAKHPVGLRWVDDYMGLTATPTPRPWVEYPKNVDWGMLGNDYYGDCTMAGLAHDFMSNAATYRQIVPSFTTQQVVSLYLQLTGGDDTGLVEADVLQYAATNGAWGYKIGGYAPADIHNLDWLRVMIGEFKSAYLGIVVPAVAQEQFNAGEPWHLTGTSADRNIEGGHCVTGIGYNAEYLYVVTWGKTQAVEWSWVSAYLEEMWAVISPQDAKVDLAALQADIKNI